MRVKKYTIILTAEDCIDTTLYIEERRIVKFALNYCTNIKSRWKEVYRVDNFHGYLHEQRFWISPEPIRIGTYLPLKEFVKEQTAKIIANFTKYRTYMERR